MDNIYSQPLVNKDDLIEQIIGLAKKATKRTGSMTEPLCHDKTGFFSAYYFNDANDGIKFEKLNMLYVRHFGAWHSKDASSQFLADVERVSGSIKNCD